MRSSCDSYGHLAGLHLLGGGVGGGGPVVVRLGGLGLLLLFLRLLLVLGQATGAVQEQVCRVPISCDKQSRIDNIFTHRRL